ncbi:MAG: hypothetical protein Q4A18_04775 [Rikenellaceae bacterium]|nr:hypothetical protein [Rikenellaceae bacterium]
MKNLFTKWMLIVAAATAFACSTDEQDTFIEKESVPVSITATAAYEAEADTRATLTPNEAENLFTAAWEVGDALAVRTEVLTDGTTFEGKESQAKLTYDGSSFTGTFKTQEGAVAWNYYAYYPYTESNSAIPFGDRVQNGNNYNSDYDLMFGSTLGIESVTPGQTADGGNIAIDMQHSMALVYFHLTNTAEWAANEKIVKAVLTSNKWFSGEYAKFSTSDYEWSIESDYRSTEIGMTFEEGTNPTADDVKLYFHIFPYAEPKLTLTLYTASHKMVIANTTPKAYNAGVLYKISKDCTEKWVENQLGQLAAPVINAEAGVTYNSVTFTWDAVTNAEGYAYSINGGAEQTTASTSVTISDLTPETAYTYALTVRALGDGALYSDSESATQNFSFTTPAAPADGEVTEKTLTLDPAVMDASELGIPTGKSALQAATGTTHKWTYGDIGFESFMCLTTSGNAAGDKVPVFYFYKASTAGQTMLKNTTSLGEIISITITLIDNGTKKGSVFTMNETANGTTQAVASNKASTKAQEHIYTFTEGNNGMFEFFGAQEDDGKITSIVINYKN